MKPVFRGRRLAALEPTAMAELGLSAEPLMEAAGSALFHLVEELLPGRGEAFLLVGPGNNGGDALVLGRYLALAGWKVAAYLPEGAKSELCRANLTRFFRAGGEVAGELPKATPTLIVDGLFGSNANRPLSGKALEAVLWANAKDAYRLAVDLPSGVDPDSPIPFGPAFSAHTTLALGALKPPHVFPPAKAFSGALHVHPLGIPLPEPDGVYLDPEDVKRPPWRDTDSKHERGRVRVLAGSAEFPGAALLVGRGALSAGAGYVELAVPEFLRPAVLAELPEAIVRTPERALEGLDRVDALVVGPGLGRGRPTEELTRAVLASGKPAVVDADALTALGAIGLDRLRPGLVLTPHRLEWERLLGDERAPEPFPAAPLARLGAVVVQKGPTTAVLKEGMVPRILDFGHPLLAQGGSGDVLAGVIGALLALGLPPEDAATVGVAWHGRAARLLAAAEGPVGAGARAVAMMLPRAARDLWP